MANRYPHRKTIILDEHSHVGSVLMPTSTIRVTSSVSPT